MNNVQFKPFVSIASLLEELNDLPRYNPPVDEALSVPADLPEGDYTLVITSPRSDGCEEAMMAVTGATTVRDICNEFASTFEKAFGVIPEGTNSCVVKPEFCAGEICVENDFFPGSDSVVATLFLETADVNTDSKIINFFVGT